MGLLNLKHINDLYKQLRLAFDHPEVILQSKWQIDLVKKALGVEEIRIMLKGKKTYLVAVLMFALGGLKGMGIIDEATYATIMGILSGLGLATLRAAVTTETNK